MPAGVAIQVMLGIPTGVHQPDVRSWCEDLKCHSAAPRLADLAKGLRPVQLLRLNNHYESIRP